MAKAEPSAGRRDTDCNMAAVDAGCKGPCFEWPTSQCLPCRESPAKCVLTTMRKIRLRKGLAAIVLIGTLVATFYTLQIAVHDISNGTYNIRTSIKGSSSDHESPEKSRYLSSDVRSPPQPVTCTPIHNVAFIKTHKAGSSTVANILQRLGITYNLNFALPRRKINTFGFNYIVRPGEVFTADKLIPLPKGQTYNILWSHSIYNKTAFHSVLPKNTAYISILREPFQQFISTFDYYGVIKAMKRAYPSIAIDANPISTFLSSPQLSQNFVSKKRHFGYVRNKEAQDFGFGEGEFENATKLIRYLNDLEHDFSLVMILEHFDESLLLLRHKLCWEIKDILYIPKNRNSRKPNRTFTEKDHKNHQLYSHVDYALYQRFERIYNKSIQKQTPDFFQELAHYKNLLQQVNENCAYKRSFTVPQTRWHKTFTVDIEDCKLMTMSEIEGLKKLLGRMNTSAGVKAV